MSAMAAELISMALKLPEVREELEAALVQVPAQPDPRKTKPQVQYKAAVAEAAVVNGLDVSHEKLTKLMKLMELLDV